MTHAGNRVHRRRREPGTSSSTGSPGTSGRRTARRSQLWLRLVLVLLFAGGVAALTPGTASAEGETLNGTLQTRGGGPIPDVEVAVATSDGEEVDTATSDENGRWEVELPGPGEYTVTLDTEGLPEGITLRGEETRTVTVDANRRQGVIFALDNAASGGGGRAGARRPAAGRRHPLRAAHRHGGDRPVADLRDDGADQLRARRARDGGRSRRLLRQRRRRCAADRCRCHRDDRRRRHRRAERTGPVAAAAPEGHRADRRAGRLDRTVAGAAVPVPDHLRRASPRRTATSAASGPWTTACSG